MEILPVWLQAYFWGLIVGSGLLLGALVPYFTDLPHRVIAAVMGFGGGVLISILSFALMEEAYHKGGFTSTIAGFILGGAMFSGMNWYLSKKGAKHRKRCGECVLKSSESEVGGRGLAIAIGALMDAIPEAIIIGLNLIGGVMIGKVVLVGFFLANIPQGLSSVSGMKDTGRSAAYIFGVWGGITLLSGAAAVVGYTVFGNFSVKVVAATSALAAGSVLAMLAETMIPEAFEKAQSFIGLITVAGFLTIFLLTKIGS